MPAGLQVRAAENEEGWEEMTTQNERVKKAETISDMVDEIERLTMYNKVVRSSFDYAYLAGINKDKYIVLAYCALKALEKTQDALFDKISSHSG
jgi:hypothetical protein